MRRAVPKSPFADELGHVFVVVGSKISRLYHPILRATVFELDMLMIRLLSQMHRWEQERAVKLFAHLGRAAAASSEPEVAEDMQRLVPLLLDG